MFEEMTEQQAREQILEMTRNYCEKYHNKKKPYQKGDRIPYASRVYDAEEMVNLVDSSLEFWLTAGRYTDEFEHAFAKYLGEMCIRDSYNILKHSPANSFEDFLIPLLSGSYMTGVLHLDMPCLLYTSLL